MKRSPTHGDNVTVLTSPPLSLSLSLSCESQDTKNQQDEDQLSSVEVALSEDEDGISHGDDYDHDLKGCDGTLITSASTDDSILNARTHEEEEEYDIEIDEERDDEDEEEVLFGDSVVEVVEPATPKSSNNNTKETRQAINSPPKPETPFLFLKTQSNAVVSCDRNLVV